MDATNKAVPDEFAVLRKLAEAVKDSGEWQTVGRTVYALEHHGWRKGIEQFNNRFSFGVQRGPNFDDAACARLAEFCAAAQPSTILRLLAALTEKPAATQANMYQANHCEVRSGERIYTPNVWRDVDHCEYIGTAEQWRRIVQHQYAATQPQPAAVSEPRDDRAAFEAWARPKFSVEQYPDGEYMSLSANAGWKAWQAARAAAPVSGQGDALTTLCAEMVKLHADRGTVLTIHMDEMQRLLSAAPVSGQGASIGDDDEFVRLAIAWDNDNGDTRPLDAQGRDTWQALIAYIDSRPRSEDSRAKVLEEAAQIGDALGKLYPEKVGYDVGYTMAANRCAAAIRALASTPPKADNE